MKNLSIIIALVVFFLLIPTSQAENTEQAKITIKPQKIKQAEYRHVAKSHCNSPIPLISVRWISWCERIIRKNGFDQNKNLFLGKNVVCTFRLGKSDKISHIKVIKSSGKNSIDDLAMEAIRQSNPFPKCAKGIGRTFFVEFSYPRLQVKLKPKPEDKFKP